jgi:hypothetical protein
MGSGNAMNGIWDAIHGIRDAMTGIWDAMTGIWDAMTGIWHAMTGIWDAIHGIWEAILEIQGVRRTCAASTGIGGQPAVFLKCEVVLTWHPRLSSQWP